MNNMYNLEEISDEDLRNETIKRERIKRKELKQSKIAKIDKAIDEIERYFLDKNVKNAVFINLEKGAWITGQGYVINEVMTFYPHHQPNRYGMNIKEHLYSEYTIANKRYDGRIILFGIKEIGGFIQGRIPAIGSYQGRIWYKEDKRNLNIERITNMENEDKERIRLKAYLLAEKDNFSQSPEHYWLKAEFNYYFYTEYL
jgi:hypothetical protein